MDQEGEGLEWENRREQLQPAVRLPLQSSPSLKPKKPRWDRTGRATEEKVPEEGATKGTLNTGGTKPKESQEQCKSMIPAPKRLRGENGEFQVSRCYIAGPFLRK